ncbi:multidrug resistance-associated protein 9 [Prunus dulcis]|uniref:Multidrug resistance-associated protein 9 n=1 Tax=Prunus dulcis TaxID=3755 RepID=A0A5H2XR55_PRUDU|nr:multidrug resistance-associated protein 9 [Prunus dulcis]
METAPPPPPSYCSQRLWVAAAASCHYWGGTGPKESCHPPLSIPPIPATELPVLAGKCKNLTEFNPKFKELDLPPRPPFLAIKVSRGVGINFGKCPIYRGHSAEIFGRKSRFKEEKEIEETKVAEKSTMAELLMKDARALGLIQSAVSDQLFPRIVNEETSKGAWDILKLEFRGDKQSYDSICSVIEHSKDLETLEVQEVVASLKSFELRLDRHTENSSESAFASLNVEEMKPKNESFLEIRVFRKVLLELKTFKNIGSLMKM